MANLTRTSWNSGWNPSQSRNGDPSALLRMDNLQQDEDGALSLVRGMRQIEIGEFPDFISDIYTKTIGNQEYLFVGLNNGAQVLVADINYTSATLLIEGGGTRPVFGASLGQVYACSGTTRIKYNGDGSGLNLGVQTPTDKPTVSAVDQPILSLTGAFAVVEGTGDSSQCFPDENTVRGILEADQGGANSLLIEGSASDDPGADRFHLSVQFENTSAFISVRIEIMLDQDNYYWREWDIKDSAIRQGQGEWSTLTSKRNEFIREGSNSNLDWKTIDSIRVTVLGNVTDNWFGASSPRFTGGGLGQLNGLYEYKYVQVRDNGIYVARSGASPKSDPVLVFNGKVTITAPITDGQATEVWVYRRSLPTTENRRAEDGSSTGDPIIPLLDQFYRVYPEAGVDNTSDIEAIRLNQKLNENIASVQLITEPFIGIEGLVNTRMLYLTKSFLYLSEENNPDGYDTTITLKMSGDPSEANLWVKQISNGLILLATTKDIYEITGTLLLNPDGTLDANIKGLGERYPPICSDFAFGSINGVGSIFYIAADGWHVTTGSNSALISPQLNKLFQGQECYKVPPIKIYPGDVARYDLAIGRNRLYCISQHDDGTRRLIVFDILRKTWRLQYLDPVSICVTETDRILLGFGGGSGNLLFELEYGDDATVDSDEPDKGQGFILETVLDHNQQPRNRKDTFTLKLNMDTGGEDVSVYLAKDQADDDQDWVHLGDYSTDKQDTIFINLAGIFDDPHWEDPLGFRYALRVTNKDDQIVRFKLYEYTIEYDPRPEQVNYLRIPSFNGGSYARKRWITVAFTIDTLGHDITFTPLIDGATKAVSTVNKDGKLTFIHFFLSDTVGVDVGGILQSDNEDEPFEFYEVNAAETITEKLPPAAKFWLIPQDDYGIPNRKRHTSYKFQINTKGGDVRFTPRVDGVDLDPQTVNTSEKRTVEIFLYGSTETNGDVVGIDIGGTLESLNNIDFEFYGTIRPQDIEVFPPRLREFWSPTENYGTPNRKRFTSVKFQMNTFGSPVSVTPIVDGVRHISQPFNTDGRRICEYFFLETLDVKGIDIALHIKCEEDDGAFEFYKIIVPQEVETLPARLTSFYPSNTNLGTASMKRIRTIPLVIDTNGASVEYTPTIDGTDYEAQSFVTLGKRTVLYYFIEDAFGIDIGGKLIGNGPFEFYGFGQFENVEILPVGKRFDQLGPFRFDKIGKLFSFRTRLIAQTYSIPYKIYSEENNATINYDSSPFFSGSITTVPNKDDIYQIDLPKNINGRTFRVVLGPVDLPFFRYDMLIKVAEPGMETDLKWVPLR